MIFFLMFLMNSMQSIGVFVEMSNFSISSAILSDFRLTVILTVEFLILILSIILYIPSAL